MPSDNTLTNLPDGEPSGVPMGGVGAGCIEMGRDGRFRNITINNNRLVSNRIALSPGSFLAVRAGVKGKVFTRILQPESSAVFESAGIIPSYTPYEQLSWRGLYPCSHYHLDDPKFPVDVTWSAMAPIIPYDTEASTLPAMFIAFFVTNPNEISVDVSTVVNWENLCGCSKDDFPERRGPIRPVVLRKDDDELEEKEKPDGPPKPAGLEFGFHGDLRDNYEGNYCLVAKQQDGVDVSLMAWDERDPDELVHFWEEFHDFGRLKNHLSRSESSHSGAVCCSHTLPAKSSRRFIYALTWFCPRFEVEGVNLGNGYTNRFRSAVHAGEVCLKYHKYFLSSVEAWQKRIFSSSLPRWFCKMLINDIYVFSTNTLYTKDERFAMFESPADPVVGALDRHLYSSFATLLFFPDFAHRELLQFAIAKDTATPGRIYRSLGRLCFHQPTHGGEGDDEEMDIGPAFLLLAFRNYCLTGNLVILRNTWPRIKDAYAYLLSKVDGDALLETSGRSTTFPGWTAYGANSYTSGLWLAAIRAYAKLATAMALPDEAKRANAVLAKAIGAFEDRLWNAEAGCYRWSQDSRNSERAAAGDKCSSAQLAGQWFADFLCMGRLLPDDRLESAIRAMTRLLEKPTGVAHALSPDGADEATIDGDPDITWPALYSAYYSNVLIYHGKVDRGLHTIQKIYQNVHVTRNIPFNQPFEWSIQNNAPGAVSSDRHMCSPSIWHTLYALQGFHMNLPEQTLWIRPNLPKNVHRLSAPLFTPSCFGWLTYDENTAKGYTQTIELQLDSPVHAKIIVLRIPAWVEEVTIRCESTAGEELTRHILGYDGVDHLVEIQAKRPIVVGNSFTLTVKGTQFGKRPSP